MSTTNTRLCTKTQGKHTVLTPDKQTQHNICTPKSMSKKQSAPPPKVWGPNPLRPPWQPPLPKHECAPMMSCCLHWRNPNESASYNCGHPLEPPSGVISHLLGPNAHVARITGVWFWYMSQGWNPIMFLVPVSLKPLTLCRQMPRSAMIETTNSLGLSKDHV